MSLSTVAMMSSINRSNGSSNGEEDDASWLPVAAYELKRVRGSSVKWTINLNRQGRVQDGRPIEYIKTIR